MNPDLYLQQAGLKSLGFDPGPIDGLPGPRTTAARAAWDLSRGTPAPPASNIPGRIVQLAQADLWIRETDGKNQGPGIKKYWDATTYKDGFENREPYCAAAVCWWIREACKGIKTPFKLPTTPVAYNLMVWPAKELNQGVLFIPKRETLLPGDIVIWEFSHASIVESPCPKGNTQVSTIDANTSPGSGDNEGGGVFRRTRSRNLIRGVVRITHT
jgi:peptidoglycan hydrolase-like protein with peptidoglycan-binding domain